jgi:hypothetical protein
VLIKEKSPSRLANIDREHNRHSTDIGEGFYRQKQEKKGAS